MKTGCSVLITRYFWPDVPVVSTVSVIVFLFTQRRIFGEGIRNQKDVLREADSDINK